MAIKRPPPPEVAASVEHAVTAPKKHAKPSVKTRDFFIFVISLVTKDIYILCKIFDFMTFKISFVKLIIQPFFWISQTNFNKKFRKNADNFIYSNLKLMEFSWAVSPSLCANSSISLCTASKASLE